MHGSRHGHRLDCVEGDITRQHGFDAVVNAANAQLFPGGGVALSAGLGRSRSTGG